MTILEDLYYGNIQPWEKMIKKGSPYQKTEQKLTKEIDTLMASLNKEEKALCEKIADRISELSDLSERERFIEGFCIGAKMMIEVFAFRSANFS